MKRRLLYILLSTGLAINLIVGAQVYFSNVQAAQRDDALPNLKLFSIVLDKVRQEYVDGENVTYQKLIHDALYGMLSKLDPHSEFMDSSKYQDLKNDTQGEFGGVGVVISLKDNYLTVVAPMEDTPGFRAGILTGDRIVKIDGKSAERLATAEAVKRLRGAPGTEVTLTVFRPSTGMTKDYTLTRALIPVSTVKDLSGYSLKRPEAFPVGENKVGYVRLTQFGEQTAGDLEDALKRLESRGAESLILDLRDNPGGLLEQAVQVCEKFLPAGQLIVSTEGRDARMKSMYHGKGRGKHPAWPIVVLVNNGSASASEIVAGCLQDCADKGVVKAIIVGEQTFGKGSVQSILPLQDGSALRLTTAKYYTPSHKVIHEKGISPDIAVPLTEDEEVAIQLRRIPGGKANLEDALRSFPADRRDALRELVTNDRDPQLERAQDLLKGMNLFSKRAADRKARGKEAPANPEAAPLQ